MRKVAREIFLQALKSSSIEQVMSETVRVQGSEMVIVGTRYRLDEFERVFLVAIGKAAGSMSLAFLGCVPGLAEWVEGVVGGPAGTCSSEELPKGLRWYAAGHPMPNEASLAAADDLLVRLKTLGENDLVIFLVSGGASAMVERFLELEMGLDEIVATHKVLVECGASITETNAVRKHLSAVKGGRLAEAAGKATQVSMFISDVPAGELDALGSGPTVPDRSTVEDAYRIAERYGMETKLPAKVAELISGRKLKESLKAEAKCFTRSQWEVLLDSSSLEKNAVAAAEAAGFYTVVDNKCDDWTAADASAYLLRRAREVAEEERRPVCVVSVGEVTVEVKGKGGVGGRNTHFALLSALGMSGDEEIAILSCGSDGIDGNSPFAGGVVDETTVVRAGEGSIEDALGLFDTGALLEGLGDVVVTGPTGNNLRDLRLVLI